MKNILLAFALSISFLLSAQSEEFLSNQLVVQFFEEITATEENTLEFESMSLNELNAINNLQRIERVGDLNVRQAYVFYFQGIADQDLPQKIDAYLATGLFEFVELNAIYHGSGVAATTPNDQFFGRQWSHVNDGSFSLSPAVADADIDMDEAWDIETGDSSIVLAVLDAGSRMQHPEFAGRHWVNNSEIPGNGVDDDNNGYVDDIHGWDFINNDENPADDHGHGTNVAGIAVATGNNTSGYAGVDWYCKLMTCKVLNSQNSGSNAGIATAVHYAVDNGAHVINMSLGGSTNSGVLKTAIDKAYANNVIVVVSMMNFNNSQNYYPAAWSETIAVGSTDANDERTDPFFWSPTSGSNFGNHIDLVAPGNYMYGLAYNSNSNYNTYWGGTSQATPLVAGICALMLAMDPTLKIEDARHILRSTAEDQVGKPSEDVAGFDIYHGDGRLNAHQALLYLQANIGINERKTANLGFWPNPVSEGKLYITAQHNDAFQATLIDQLGRVHLQRDINLEVGKNEFDLIGVPSGLYILKLSNSVKEEQIKIMVQ